MDYYNILAIISLIISTSYAIHYTIRSRCCGIICDADENHININIDNEETKDNL
jgi:hypothetical protein